MIIKLLIDNLLKVEFDYVELDWNVLVDTLNNVYLSRVGVVVIVVRLGNEPNDATQEEGNHFISKTKGVQVT